MKSDIHPDYREVVFVDGSVDPPYRVLTRSTAETTETVEWEDGKTYPLVRVEISSASHPYYTGKMMLIDSAGMIDRYRRRWGGAEQAEPQEAQTTDTTPSESSDS